MKKAVVFITLVILAGCGGQAPHPMGGDELRNGGDPLPKRFENGRGKARRILEAVTALEVGDFPAGRGEAAAKLVGFYAEKRGELADDVRDTPEFEWVKANSNGACGATGVTRRAVVRLSYDDCTGILTETDAAIHLAGESAHHLGIASDSETALFAVALLKAWHRYLGLQPDGIARKITFEEGRAYLKSMLSRLRATDLETPDDRAWLARQGRSIGSAPFEWVDELPNGACAAKDPAGTIKLSYSACGQINDRAKAAKTILAAEVAAGGNETFESALAFAEGINTAWIHAGHLDTPHLVQLEFPRELGLDLNFAPFVWTGKELLTWASSGVDTIGMATLDPRSGKWTALKDLKSPSRWFADPYAYSLAKHQIVVAGNHVLRVTECMAGARTVGIGDDYDIEKHEWAPIDNPPPLLSSRSDFELVTTGDRAIVFGGKECSKPGRGWRGDGAIYDPARKTWEWIRGVPRFEGRSHFAVTWAGDRLIVWGGCRSDESECFNDGASYDPATRKWTDLPTAGAPSARMAPAAVWTDDALVIFGGMANNSTYYIETGARYYPRENRWEPMNMKNGPPGSSSDAIFARPNVVVVSQKIRFYHPGRDEWTVLERMPVPAFRRMLWTGAEVVFWNGVFNYALYP